jgi:hypothetical protein
MLCDRVIARELLRGLPVGWRERALPPEHFEFRGGELGRGAGPVEKIADEL